MIVSQIITKLWLIFGIKNKINLNCNLNMIIEVTFFKH